MKKRKNGVDRAMDYKMYIMTHKKFNVPKIKGYVPMQVGAYKGYIDDYCRDNMGTDHISQKNANYCELTGLYWIWKNDNSTYVGLCHYRRYFTSNRFSRKAENFMKLDEAVKVLESYDVIVPNPTYFTGKKVRKYYAVGHYVKDLDETRNVIQDICPEYLEDFDWFMGQRCGYSFNMFFASKALIDQYCEWLFSVLFELEKRIDISDYDVLQSRIYGFLSERLFNVWIKHNGLKVYEQDVVNIQESRLVFFRRIPLECVLDFFDVNCRKYAEKIGTKRMGS